MLPEHNPAYNRQIGIRLFNAVLLIDTFKNCEQTPALQVDNYCFPEGSYNTAVPANCDDNCLMKDGIVRDLPLCEKCVHLRILVDCEFCLISLGLLLFSIYIASSMLGCGERLFFNYSTCGLPQYPNCCSLISSSEQLSTI